MGHNGCLMYCQITADEERRLSRNVVVVLHPRLAFPQFRPLPAHSIPQTRWNLLVQLFLYHLTTWYKLMVDNSILIKKHNQRHLDLWPTHLCFFWGGGDPSTATIASWFQHHTHKPHVSSPLMMFLRKFSSPFALASSSWLISTRFSFWSSVNKRGTNFALTRRVWSFSVKIWWQDPMLMPTSSRTVNL